MFFEWLFCKDLWKQISRKTPRVLASEQEQTQEGGSSSRCFGEKLQWWNRPIPFRDGKELVYNSRGNERL